MGKRREQNIQKLWDNYKRCNTCVMEIPEGGEEILEVRMAENFPKLMTDSLCHPLPNSECLKGRSLSVCK